jgi:predicted CxxxxCH...CXXCH cytochrome family protein
MKRSRFPLILVLFLLSALSACSSPNNQAPTTGQVHGRQYLLSHGSKAKQDDDSCKSCHGSDLDGTTNVTGCLSCHPDGEPITVHTLPYSDPSHHGAAARDNLRQCFNCHGTAPNRFDGGLLSDPAMFNAANANCSAAGCHSNAGAHPAHWQGDNDNSLYYHSTHRAVSRNAIDTGCAMCHQVAENGPRPNNDAPSCFSSGFTNSDGSTTGCHTDGPGAAHDLPFDSPELHGAEAKADLSACQACHGTPGTTSFAGGSSGASCADCHSTAGAHPTRWQSSDGDSPDYRSSHSVVSQNAIDTGCAVCHQVEADGPQPNNAAPSCFSASITYGDNSTTGCHAAGPGTAHDLPFDSPELHGAEAKADLSACQACHGTPGETDFSGGTSGISCADCHGDAGAHPVRWQGGNDNTAGYISNHRSAGKQSSTCAICHDVVEGNPSPNANAPSCFSATFTNGDGSTTGCHASGPGAPHPVPYAQTQHGVDAKENLSSCVACHATPTDAGAGDNPRFNVAIGDLANGCEDCHAANTAHPTPLWTGAAATSHASASRMATDCALCHGADLNGPAGGGVGPACTDCHAAGSPLTLTNCTSCHNWPADGQAPAGDQFPNRDGAHAVHNALAGVNGNCSVCHEGAGTESALHFDGGGAAVVALASAYDAQSGTAGYDANAKTCGTTRCHGGQTSPHWFNGTIDVAGDCRQCHATSSGQHNAATSGEHRKHVVEEGMSCTACHNASLLSANHFSNLATTGFEGDPGNTLNTYLNYNPGTRSGCSVNGCHGTENW